MLVFGPLWRKQLAKKAKLSSVSGRKLSNGATITCCCHVRFIVRYWHRRRWWWECEEKRIEHADDLVKAWSQIRIFNPTWLYDKSKFGGYIIRNVRPLLLQSQMQTISWLAKNNKLNYSQNGSFGSVEICILNHNDSTTSMTWIREVNSTEICMSISNSTKMTMNWLMNKDLIISNLIP